MKKIYSSKKWFSIVLAMWITIVISLIAILILEFIIPFSRNVKSVENWSSAYYYAYSWIENSLWELAKQVEDWFDFSDSSGLWNTWSTYDLVSMTSIIPPIWDGNSEYDKDWNRFDPNIPIQLSLTDNGGNKISNIDFSNTRFHFRVPDITGTWSKTLSGSSNRLFVNWILSWIDNSWDPTVLNASWSSTNHNYIRKSNMSWAPFTIWLKYWLTLEWSICSIESFFERTWSLPCTNQWIQDNPILKFSIVDSLEDDEWWMIPYLEYKIEFRDSSNNPISIPWRYSQINTAGKSNGYKKTMDIKVPQTSTNQAFDFAVFQ